MSVSRVTRLAILIGLLCSLQTQPVSAQWAFGIGGVAWESGEALAVTSDDEVVVTGWSTADADWDPSPSEVVSLPGVSGYVARYRADGSLAWVRGLPGIGYGVALNDTDDVFVVSKSCEVRRFSAGGEELWMVTLTFGHQCFDLALGEGGYLYVGGNYLHVARLNPENGDVLWSHQLGNSNADRIVSLTASQSGGVVWAAEFHSSFDADPGAEESLMIPTGAPDAALVAFDSLGNHRWGFGLNASEFGGVTAIATDEAGAVYATGLYSGTLDFGSGPVQAADVAAFVAKYDRAGQLAWVRTANGSGTGRTLAVRGSLVVAAGNSHGMNFHPQRQPEEQLAERRIFIAQFDTAGTYHWIRGLTTLHSLPWAVGLDSSAAIYLSGILWDFIDFDPGPGVFEIKNFQTSVGRSSELPDFFLARFEPGGVFAVRTESNSVVPASVVLGGPYPHPSRGRAKLSLSLDRPTSVVLVLYDVLGRRVHEQSHGRLPAGVHTVAVDLYGLPQGLYLVSLEGRPGTSRMIVVQ